MEFRNAIFVVTEEIACPIYNVGEEFRVADMGLTVPEAKPACLKLVQEIIRATGEEQVLARYSQSGTQKSKFECGGCAGLIRFEYKKEKEFATLQMKLLAAAQKREKLCKIDKFFDVLRSLTVFEPLKDDDLRELGMLLKLQPYVAGSVVLQKGDPGNSLYIVLEGEVAIIGENNTVLTELRVGDIFGEMSLLSGEPVTTSVLARTDTRLAMLSSKDFKHVLNRYPVLQVFFYRMLVERAQANAHKTGTINSGMSGKLEEINAVELFQLINSSQKTGRVDLELADGRAVVLFNEGEIVQARYGPLEGKEALFAILARGTGRFVYTSGLSDEALGLPVIGGFMGLIMEGMRRIDEQQGDAA